MRICKGILLFFAATLEQLTMCASQAILQTNFQLFQVWSSIIPTNQLKLARNYYCFMVMNISLILAMKSAVRILVMVSDTDFCCELKSLICDDLDILLSVE